MSHSHWPTKHPFNKTRRCELPKVECDRIWREYQHGHEGERCIMELKPKGKIETCAIRGRITQSEENERTKEWQVHFMEFIDKEIDRILKGGPPV